VGGVGARSRKRGGLGYRLVRKRAWTEMLGLLISMFLGLGYILILGIYNMYILYINIILYNIIILI